MLKQAKETLNLDTITQLRLRILPIGPKPLLGLPLLLGLGVILVVILTPSSLKARAAILKPDPPQVVEVKLRDDQGQSLAQTRCEVLSYDWGKPVGQPYAVIFKGQTDQTGQVAFEVNAWPRSGYLFRVVQDFNPEVASREKSGPHQSETENEGSQGYSEQIGSIWLTIGGQNEQLFLVVDPAGQLYIDLNPTGLPRYQASSASGPDQTHTTPLAAATFLAQVGEGHNTGRVINYSTAPAPTPDRVQTVLAQSQPTSKTNFNQQSAAARPTAMDEEIILALFGLISFGLFWKFRSNIYSALGLAPARRRRVKLKKAHRPTRTKAPIRLFSLPHHHHYYPAKNEAANAPQALTQTEAQDAPIQEPAKEVKHP
jgi:hypothetical protein